MSGLTLIAIAIFLLLIIMAALGKHMARSGPSGPWPLYARKAMTAPEQVLYWRLVQALPDHIVLAQVQLSRILGVKKGHRFHEWNNRINRLSADFVVCAKDSSVLAVIELDDATHQRRSRAETDEKKSAALAAAGIHLIRWKVSAIPSNTEIAAVIHPPTHAVPAIAAEQSGAPGAARIESNWPQDLEDRN